MNEKFIKDEVWGHLGKSNQSQSKDKVVNESGGDEYDSPDEYDAELSKIEIKPSSLFIRRMIFFIPFLVMLWTITLIMEGLDTRNKRSWIPRHLEIFQGIGVGVTLFGEVLVVGSVAHTMVEEVMMDMATWLGVMVEVCIPKVGKNVLVTMIRTEG